MSKRAYYSDSIFWKQMKESDADIKILLSDRGPGKSFAVKDLVLDQLPDRRFCAGMIWKPRQASRRDTSQTLRS